MATLFVPGDRSALLERLAGLTPDAPRQWGKMDPAQMMTHCSLVLEMALGEPAQKQRLIGRILAPFVRESALGAKPFGRNAPTGREFTVADARDFAREQDRLGRVIGTFAERGPEAAGRQAHAFFGSLRGDQWGVLMHKHLDHHLRQFRA